MVHRMQHQQQLAGGHRYLHPYHQVRSVHFGVVWGSGMFVLAEKLYGQFVCLGVRFFACIFFRLLLNLVLQSIAAKVSSQRSAEMY